MNGIVWGNQFERAKEKLMEVINSYEEANIRIDSSRMNKQCFEVIFENGDAWKTVRASELARGYRSDISYVDNNIPKDIINTIIRPATISPSDNSIYLY